MSKEYTPGQATGNNATDGLSDRRADNNVSDCQSERWYALRLTLAPIVLYYMFCKRLVLSSLKKTQLS